MTKMILSNMIILMSIIMFFLNNPMSMGLMILMQTMLTCILSGMLIKTYWFSYILFLTFMGGLLVLFIYVSSIASNELFNLKFLTKMLFISFIIMMIMIQIILNINMNWMNFSNNSDMSNMFNLYMMSNNMMENKINLNKFYNNQTYFMMMMLVIYLFITLIAIVKITNIFYGPLRSSKY
uniref:NADH-ubiquinone oxidoreductase chain 6 n=1 Tax=Ochrogaster lunifer TaxID=319761 RepID=B4F325_OCHLU|nr:NADH dehydrogenase subunit 6 [Ochrogaster lunifer]CAQ19289.1 NADH dehydrogenase subunit 6 [Ochrogaster lunifer]